jgi:protein-disulfide isomerase
VYFHFPFLGEESYWAAEASECANDQNKFWEYHDVLFARQNGENQGAFAKDLLKQFAQTLQLDMEAFNACLDTGKYTKQVQQDAAFAQQLGVRSTPTFLVNGEPIMGAQPFETFREMIEAQLK